MATRRDPLEELRSIHEELLAPCKMADGSRRQREQAEADYQRATEGGRKKAPDGVMMLARQRDAVAMLFVAGIAIKLSERLETYFRELDAASPPPAPAPPPPQAPHASRTTTRVPLKPAPAALPARKKSRS
jgi:hypothetical protein